MKNGDEWSLGERVRLDGFRVGVIEIHWKSGRILYAIGIATGNPDCAFGNGAILQREEYSNPIILGHTRIQSSPQNRKQIRALARFPFNRMVRVHNNPVTTEMKRIAL